MSRASRRRRRQAVLAGMCPNCLERPSEHVAPVGRRHLEACSECWPAVVDLLESMGARVTGCLGPCCQA